MSWVSDLFAHPWRRYVAYGGLAVVGLLIVLRLFAFTPFAHSFVESRVEAMSVRGQVIELDRLRGDLLGRLKADRLTIADADGTWLTVEQVDLKWSPFALLGGHLDLAHVRADLIGVARRPVLGPAPKETQASPIDRMDLRALDIATLNLAGGVAGPAQSYALSGRVSTERLTGALGLDLRPTAVFGDKARIDLEWGEQTPLQGQASISGAPSGLIATLLGLPSGQAFSASLAANGSPANWDVQVNASADSASILSLNASRADGAFRGEGRIDLASFGRLQMLRDRIGDDVEFRGELDADRRAVGRLVSSNGQIEFDGRALETDQGLTFDQLTITADGLDLPAISGVSELSLPSLTYAGDLTWLDNRLSLIGRFDVPQVSYGDYAADTFVSSGTYQVASESIEIATEFAVNRFEGLPESIDSAVDDRIQGSIDARYLIADERLDVSVLELNSGDHRIDLAGTRSSDGTLDIAGSFALAAVSVLEQASGDWTVQGRPSDGLLASLQGAVSPAPSRPELATLIGPRADIEVQIRSASDSVLIETAELRSSVVSVTARGNISADEIAISARAAADRFAYAPVTSDALEIDLSVSGPVSNPSITADARADLVHVSGETFTTPVATLSADLSSTRTLALQLNADYRGAPLTSSIRASMDEAGIDVPELDIQWDELIAAGQGRLDMDAIQRSSVELDISGAAPVIGDLAGLVRYTDEVLALDMRTSEVALGALDLQGASLNLAGQWPRFEGDVSYDGRLPLWGSDEVVSGRHSLRLKTDQSRLMVGGETRLADQVFEFTTPMELSFGERPQLNGIVSAFGGQVELSLDPSGQTQSEIDLQDLQLSALGAFLQRPGLRGQLTGDAQLQIIESDLQGGATVSIENLRRGLAESADLAIHASIEAGAVLIALTGSNEAGDLSLAGQIQTALIHRGDLVSIRPDPEARMPISLTGSGPLAPIWALAAPTDLRVEGDFMADINNGDGSSFRFLGPVAWRNGVFEDGFTGLHLVDIAVEADLSADEIRLRDASASGVKGGTLKATGAYSFNGDGDVVVELDRVNAANRSDVEARVSGEARVDRRNRQTHIQGDLVIDRAQINLSNLPGAGYTTLDVVFMEDSDQGLPEAPTREAISLNVSVQSDRRIFVDGPGTESEWGINARVTGPAGAPQVNGQATLIRGEVDLLSRSFRMSEGIVRFIGESTESEVSLQADRTNDGVTTSILVSGTVSAPEISLSSDPTLPEDEILARVLFGRSPTNLSAIQAAQLAAAAAQLAGGDALSLTGELEAATGLDRLDFGFDEDGGATLSTGKYLADDLYLEVESASSGAPGVTIEWTPLDNLEVDAELDPELGPKVAIQWRLDFDRLPGETPGETTARGSGKD